MTISTHTYRAYLIGSPDVDLPLSGGTITLDVGAAPHVQATLDISAPGYWGIELVEYEEGFGYGEAEYGSGGYGGYYFTTSWIPDLATLDALDLRDNVRIRIVVDVTIQGGATQHREFDLNLRARDVDYKEEVIRLEIASDEGLLQDFAPLADDTTPLSLSTSIRNVVDYVLDMAIPGEALESSPSFDEDLSAGADPEAFTWKAGQSALDFLHPLVQAAGFRLVCDEARAWTLRDEAYEAPGVSLSIRNAVNMLSSDETISRDSGIWFDAAVTRYTWTDSGGLEQVAVDSYALTTPYSKLQLFERSTPYPGAGFSQYAVRRAQQRGREVQATIVSDWTAQAEEAMTIYMNDTLTQVGKTERVVFDLNTDEMSISARTQDTPEGAIDLMSGIINDLVGTINDQ